MIDLIDSKKTDNGSEMTYSDGESETTISSTLDDVDEADGLIREQFDLSALLNQS